MLQILSEALTLPYRTFQFNYGKCGVVETGIISLAATAVAIGAVGFVALTKLSIGGSWALNRSVQGVCGGCEIIQRVSSATLPAIGAGACSIYCQLKLHYEVLTTSGGFDMHLKLMRDGYAWWCIRWTQQPLSAKSSMLRDEFRSMPSVVGLSKKTVPHAQAAYSRTHGATMIDSFCSTIGITPYYYQQAKCDVEHGRCGSRDYRWASDAMVRPSLFAPGGHDAVCMVDVDQYIDMNYMLVNWPRVYLIYTVQPQTVGAARDDYSFWFDAMNVMTFHVAGGATYVHQVWNYGVDVLCAKIWDRCGLRHRVVFYNVEHRHIGVDHSVIMLVPSYAANSWFFPVLGDVNAKRLERLQPHVGDDYVAMRIQTEKGMFVSLGSVNSPLSVEVSADQYSGLMHAALNYGKQLTHASVMRLVPDIKVERSHLLAAFMATVHVDKLPVIVRPLKDIMAYQPFTSMYCQADEKSCLSAFMKPIIEGAFVPVVGKANDKYTVDERVVNIAPSILKMTNRQAAAIQAFLQRLVPEPHQLIPVPAEVVFERQKRATQQAILKIGDLAPDGDEAFSSFMKKESYVECKPPRNITTMTPALKLDYSQVVYALNDVFHRCSWYAFKLTPAQVAERVACVLTHAKFAVASDFSKMDGRVSNLLRHLERCFLLRAFKPEYHGEVLKIWKKQQHHSARTQFGVKYSTGFSRTSGSPETSDFNTLGNAFIAFATFDIMGLSFDECWGGLGIYGGDDGLTANIATDTYKQVAETYGQKLETILLQRGNRGVKFLSRVYSPDVWEGDQNTMCSLHRQLVKFHLTDKSPLHLVDKLREKAVSYYWTDCETPVLGELCEVVVEKLGVYSEVTTIRSYNVRTYAREVQYPNRYAPWMEEEALLQLPHFDFKGFRKWIGDLLLMCSEEFATAVLQCPGFSRCQDQVVVNPNMVVNGDVVTATHSVVTRPVKPRVERGIKRKSHWKKKDAIATRGGKAN
jgi:hypothetical protein